MVFSNTEVFNIEGALRGMRNPLNSWAKGDSLFSICCEHEGYEDVFEVADAWARAATKDMEEGPALDDLFDETYEKRVEWLYQNGYRGMNIDHHATIDYIGPNDMDLCQRLGHAGPEHRKYMRQIFISVDITAPLYWWKEADTYKVGTTANSTSTMHKLASTPITLDCFEIGDYDDSLEAFEFIYDSDKTDKMPMGIFVSDLISDLEALRQKYNETQDKRYWKELIRWLPNGWLQTRTWTANYEVLRNMYHQRKNHKLVEWHAFCKWVESLPYAKELIID